MKNLEDSHRAFWNAILKRGPGVVASRAGARADGPRIVLPLAGKTFTVDTETKTVLEGGPGENPLPAGYTEAVVLLTYLETADGFPLTGQWVTERGLPHGDAYFRAPQHALPVRDLADRFGDDPQGLVRAAIALAGKETGEADAGVELPALPRVPVRFNLWRPDEEFPTAEVKTFFDRSAGHYLILDGVQALVAILVRALIEAAEESQEPS